MEVVVRKVTYTLIRHNYWMTMSVSCNQGTCRDRNVDLLEKKIHGNIFGKNSLNCNVQHFFCNNVANELTSSEILFGFAF